MAAGSNEHEVAYLLDNAGTEAPARFAALSAMFDSGTIRHLEARGIALSEVEAALEKRTAQSGHEEKASRSRS